MKRLLIYTTIAVGLFACKKEVMVTPGDGYEDWTASSHSYDAAPNYAIVFNENKVHRLDIVIGSDYWTAMEANLADILGSSGGPGGGFSDENPMYVPCQLYYDGTQWYDVGIRYKGNSSLTTAYQQDIGKLPFRLEFNHFDDENPSIWGQKFYGFQQLAFSSGFKDMSLIREKIAPDLFREFGVPAARTAFYRIYIDYGSGPVYFGLYTMVEVIFDTMLGEQFSGSEGNCFKPDQDGAHLNDLSNISEKMMPNKTNPGVYTEVSNLITALISTTRTSNPSQWRTNLESVIDMPQYLKYLAANTTIANWDTYGTAAHNYYLYADPADGKLNWIPWDNNESLTTTGSRTTLDFDFSNMTNQSPTATGDHTWPLVYYIYNDPVYKAQYDQYIDDFIQTVFTVSNVQNKVNTASNMIEDYVIGANGEQPGYTFLGSSADFTTAISDLNTYATTRRAEADNYTP